MRFDKYILALLLAPTFILGCSQKSDREKTVGIWHIHSLLFDGDSKTDGKDWFQFFEDGKVRSRTLSGEYDLGWWNLSKEKKAIYLKSNPNDSIAYNYLFAGDTLKLSTTLRLVHDLKIEMTRVEKPITDIKEETGSDWPDWPSAKEPVEPI